jgi:hypothetical protein
VPELRSQACTGAGSSCPSGLVCQQLAIDQQYLDTIQSRLTPAQFQQMFGQLGSSFYCVKPQ